MDLEDDELYIIEGRQLKELFNCVLCKTKLKKGSTLLCQENVRLSDKDGFRPGLVKTLRENTSAHGLNKRGSLMRKGKQAYSLWTFMALVQLLYLGVALLRDEWLSGQWATKRWAREV